MAQSLSKSDSMIAEASSRWYYLGSIPTDEYHIPILILSATLVLFSWYQLVHKKSRNKVPLPPGPRGLPIVGSLPFLDPNFHTYLAKLSKKYGPILKLQLGGKVCIVLSSPAVVEEVHKSHDINFSNHDLLVVGNVLTYNGMDMAFSPYGEQWRMLRKIGVQELLSQRRLEDLYCLRRREVREMVNKVYSNNIGKPVNIRECMVVTLFQLLTSVLWGGTLEKQDRDRISKEFGEVLDEVFKLIGLPNVSDLFPALAWLDIQGMKRKMKKNNLWLDKLFDFVIGERLRVTNGGKLEIEHKDFLQVLLQIKDKGDLKTSFTITHVKALLLDMLVAGSKTSATSIEWVMALLMKHPEAMAKVQDEIKENVGMENVVEELHLQKLKYLNAVIKEAMRLHTVGPLLIPRTTSESCIVAGYCIPKGAKVIVNAWAIHRDPDNWENPLEFKPERFLNAENNYDYNGTNYSFMPFGSGRRVCVGIPLVERMVPYIVASLVHSFDWKLPDGSELDLSDTFGIELTKTIPLLAIPEPRLSGSGLYA